MATDFLTIQRAIEGDERALRSLWSQHAPHIDAVVRRLAGDPDLAEDIAQEVWIQIFRALPSYRGESQFGTWAHRIAVNRTLNALRRTRRLTRIETDIEEETVAVEHGSERAMLAASIDAAASRLSPGARTVFLLHDVEGYTHEEIATELGITPGVEIAAVQGAGQAALLAHLVDAPELNPDRKMQHLRIERLAELGDGEPSAAERIISWNARCAPPSWRHTAGWCRWLPTSAGALLRP